MCIMFRRGRLAGLAVAASAALAGLTGSASAALVHQYTFNDGTANDSVGSVNGTLAGSATIAGGALSPTVSNPSGATLPVAVASGITSDFSVELWFTPTTVNNNRALLAIGHYTATSPTADQDMNFLYLKEQGNGVAVAIHSDAGQGFYGGTATSGGTLTAGIEHMMAATYTVDGSGNGTQRLYLDGNLLGTSALPLGDNFSLSQAAGTGVLSYNGKPSVGIGGYYYDTALDGTINEVRIFDDQQSGTAIADAYAAGPVSIPEPASLALLALGGLGLLARRRQMA